MKYIKILISISLIFNTIPIYSYNSKAAINTQASKKIEHKHRVGHDENYRQTYRAKNIYEIHQIKKDRFYGKDFSSSSNKVKQYKKYTYRLMPISNVEQTALKYDLPMISSNRITSDNFFNVHYDKEIIRQINFRNLYYQYEKDPLARQGLLGMFALEVLAYSKDNEAVVSYFDKKSICFLESIILDIDDLYFQSAHYDDFLSLFYDRLLFYRELRRTNSFVCNKQELHSILNQAVQNLIQYQEVKRELRYAILNQQKTLEEIFLEEAVAYNNRKQNIIQEEEDDDESNLGLYITAGAILIVAGIIFGPALVGGVKSFMAGTATTFEFTIQGVTVASTAKSGTATIGGAAATAGGIAALSGGGTDTNSLNDDEEIIVANIATAGLVLGCLGLAFAIHSCREDNLAKEERQQILQSQEQFLQDQQQSHERFHKESQKN